jgi:hypothetical protein
MNDLQFAGGSLCLLIRHSEKFSGHLISLHSEHLVDVAILCHVIHFLVRNENLTRVTAAN